MKSQWKRRQWTTEGIRGQHTRTGLVFDGLFGIPFGGPYIHHLPSGCMIPRTEDFSNSQLRALVQIMAAWPFDWRGLTRDNAAGAHVDGIPLGQLINEAIDKIKCS